MQRLQLGLLYRPQHHLHTSPCSPIRTTQTPRHYIDGSSAGTDTDRESCLVHRNIALGGDWAFVDFSREQQLQGSFHDPKHRHMGPGCPGWSGPCVPHTPPARICNEPQQACHAPIQMRQCVPPAETEDARLQIETGPIACHADAGPSQAGAEWLEGTQPSPTTCRLLWHRRPSFSFS